MCLRCIVFVSCGVSRCKRRDRCWPACWPQPLNESRVSEQRQPCSGRGECIVTVQNMILPVATTMSDSCCVPCVTRCTTSLNVDTVYSKREATWGFDDAAGWRQTPVRCSKALGVSLLDRGGAYLHRRRDDAADPTRTTVGLSRIRDLRRFFILSRSRNGGQ
jgi:hypothetical protein